MEEVVEDVPAVDPVEADDDAARAASALRAANAAAGRGGAARAGRSVGGGGRNALHRCNSLFCLGGKRGDQGRSGR